MPDAPVLTLLLTRKHKIKTRQRRGLAPGGHGHRQVAAPRDGRGDEGAVWRVVHHVDPDAPTARRPGDMAVHLSPICRRDDQGAALHIVILKGAWNMGEGAVGSP